MKRVHSISWFRHDASGYESPNAGTSQGIFFANFIPTLVRAHYAAFKGFELWIHHDDRVREFEYFGVLQRMHAAGLLRLVPMGPAGTLCGGMLWRLDPVWDADVEYVVCRDVDSLPMHRDRKMIEEFIASGAAVHAVLDSESHCGPLMGGMVAFHAPSVREAFPGIRDVHGFIALGKGVHDLNQHGADQRILNGMVWPRLHARTLIHQRRQDVMYPHAMRTLPVAPQQTVLDQVVRHIGAGYDREKANAVIDEHHRYADITGHDRIRLLETLHLPSPEPWYVLESIRFLETVIKPDWHVLEIGGGGSTRWYRDRVNALVCVERDPFWKTMIESTTDVKCHANVPEPLGDFDLIAIDGADRVTCVKHLHRCIKPGGYLLLDNSEKHPEAGEILSGWERRDFKAADRDWTTSIWRRPDA